jgi:dipeptidyl-peptidase-4
MRFLTLLLSILLAYGCTSAISPSSPETIDFLERYAKTGAFSFGRPRHLAPLDDGRWLFLQSPPDSHEQTVMAFNPETNESTTFLTRSALVLGDVTESEAEKARRERRREFAGGITWFKAGRDSRSILFHLGGLPYLYNQDTQRAAVFDVHRPTYDPKLSPDERFLSYVYDKTVWIQPVDKSAPPRALIPPLGGQISYGLAEFVAQEEMGRMAGDWWGPQSKQLIIQRTDNTPVETWHVSSPGNPKKSSSARRYPAAGTANAEVGLIRVNLDGGQVPIRWDKTQFPYLATVRWQRHGPPLLVVQNRPQTETAVLAVALDTGATRVLHIETDAAWINLDQAFPRWIEGGAAWLWASERTGAWQIERRQPDGGIERTITPKLPGYMKVEAWLEDAMVLAVAAPSTERHLVRYSFTGGGGVRLTTEPGVHYGTFRKKGSQWMHWFRSAVGEQSLTLHSESSAQPGPASQAAEPGFVPSLEVMTVPCGVNDCDAAVIRPRNMVPGFEYPVLVYVYGGPHYKVVANDPRRYYRQQWLADQGFVVLMVDGRGTPARGRVFERAIAGDLATVPVQDQVAGIRALLERVDGVDAERVGVYGWSFGGYLSSMLLLRAPDLFKAAVSGAPVTDWRLYDTHYTERYMGLVEKNREGYDATSLVKHAASLSRPLMLVHGTRDDNVYPVHTIKFSHALFSAGIAHRVHFVPGYTHRVDGPTITRRRYELLVDFFRVHLGEN